MSSLEEPVEWVEVDRNATFTLELTLPGDWTDWSFAATLRVKRDRDSMQLAAFSFGDPAGADLADDVQARTFVSGAISAATMATISPLTRSAYFDVKATRAGDGAVDYVYRANVRFKETVS